MACNYEHIGDFVSQNKVLTDVSISAKQRNMENIKIIQKADGLEERQKQKDLIQWQTKLLPWMVILPSLLILVFVYLATRQLNIFSSEINNYKTSELDKTFLNARDSVLKIPGNIKADEFTKLYILSKMEEQSMNKRYSQAGALLTARLYTKYLGFFTGMILSIVGAVFIISKLKEDTSNLELSSEKFKLAIISSSPGIIFGILGTMLMMTTIIRHTGTEIQDSAIYFNSAVNLPGNPEDQSPVPVNDSILQKMKTADPTE